LRFSVAEKYHAREVSDNRSIGLRWCNEAGGMTVTFKSDSILRDAQTRAGLTNYGDGAFREPLSMLLKSLREEAPLNELGRLAMHTRIVESLETRLKTQDLIDRHPEILEERIDAPLVVVGLMRTGTTMLHRVLASDPRNHAAMWWETRFPAPPREIDWDQPDPRIGPAEAEVAAILAADPRQASIHPWDANAADEEILLLELNKRYENVRRSPGSQT